MSQASPQQLAVPGATRSGGESAGPARGSAARRVGGALLLEQLEHGPHRALYLLVGIEHDAVAIPNEADRQRKAQLALVCFVELAAVQARANNMQLGLGERALHAEHEAVVELGRIVATVLVDHERAGDGAQLEQTMPVLVGTSETGSFEREDGSHVAHRHIADQRLEVLALGRPRTGLAETQIYRSTSITFRTGT